MPALDFNALLLAEGIDLQGVVILRHQPYEPKLRKAFRRIIADRRELFDAYQCTHGPRVEAALKRARHVASFYGHEPGKALFVGLYRMAGHRRIGNREYWSMPEHLELREQGMQGNEGSDFDFFDLQPLPSMAGWSGRLVCDWPGKELSWYRWADRNTLAVDAISVESLLIEPVPAWHDLVLDWNDLQALPGNWRIALQQWRGIYHIRDRASGKGYVGAAYGKDNLLGRWLECAASGHGDNKRLKGLDPEGFRFSILQLLPLGAEKDDVTAVERTWKRRLHTLHPDGLNDNY